MSQLIYPALFGVSALLYTMPTAASEKEQTQVQPLNSVIIQSRTKDWKQANQKVAELGGWQFYASEAGAHQGMDHSQHGSEAMMDHSGHKMPVDHSKHNDHQRQMDHTQHSKPVDHSKHKHHHQMDHSQHSEPHPVKTGDEHEHHH
jgi:hypothetical protein